MKKTIMTSIFLCAFFGWVLAWQQNPAFFKGKTKYKISAKLKKGAKSSINFNSMEGTGDGNLLELGCGIQSGPCDEANLFSKQSPKQPKPCICKVVLLTYVGDNEFTVKSDGDKMIGSFKAAKLSRNFINGLNALQDKTLVLTAR